MTTLPYQGAPEAVFRARTTVQLHHRLSMKAIALQVRRVLFAKETVTTTVNAKAISSVTNGTRLLNLLLAVLRAVLVILLRRTIVSILAVPSLTILVSAVRQASSVETVKAIATVTLAVKGISYAHNGVIMAPFAVVQAMEILEMMFAQCHQVFRSSPLQETATVAVVNVKVTVTAIVTASATWSVHNATDTTLLTDVKDPDYTTKITAFNQEMVQPQRHRQLEWFTITSLSTEITPARLLLRAMSALVVATRTPTAYQDLCACRELVATPSLAV
mmetsp:Transcript_52687/g.78683  ORF Transcript_52687/g.78683 Transcript_52687/m.78683 type:complete len:275 (-) Transcript_52687:369-1193(-)